MHDTLEQIECPACGKVMQKIPMSESGTMIDICLDGCGGIFFDGQELKHFDEQNENIDEIEKAIEGKTFNKTDESKTRICPVCGNKMVKNSVSIKHEIIIDECYNCGSKFFDHGELTKMREQYPTEEDRRQDFLASAYAQFGKEIDKLEFEHNMHLATRPKFLRFIDKLFIGR